MGAFVNVRIVKMKDVDLAQFQFDYDLTWAAFFMNADGTIYGRYGTRSAAGPMAHNSMASLKNAMKRALQLHQNYPENRASLGGKRGPEPRWKTALQIPALWKKFRKQLAAPIGQTNCIHCHNIYDGWRETAYAEGTFDRESLWVYPLPDNIGVQIHVDEGNLVEKVIAGSFAEKAGVKAGDVIHTMYGQPVISQADMQWVLHHLPKTADLRIGMEREGEYLTRTLFLSGDWKRSDISWRGSLWSLRPRTGFEGARDLSVEQKEQLDLAPEALALEVWSIVGAAREAGLREGDIIIEADAHTELMTGRQFAAWVRLNYHPGDKLPIKVLRASQNMSLTLPSEYRQYLRDNKPSIRGLRDYQKISLTVPLE